MALSLTDTFFFAALKNSGGTILNKHAYLYNGGGQRQRNTLLDGSYTTYSFDDDGQLASSLGYTSGGVPLASEQLTFLYDPGWNLTNRSVNGGAGAYTVDSRNQLATEPGFTDAYDVHGNLVGRYNGNNQLAYGYTFDQEQRLISGYYQDPAVPTSYWYRTDYTYDGLSRLRVRSEFTWMVGTGWYQGPVTRYIYDGMRVVQERTGTTTPSVAYTRGKDLSGTLEGAGGIGGLLARSHGYSAGNWSTHNFYHADALGNITYMVSSAQAMVASYKYDPYGRTMSSSGTLASANLYRFSSKEITAVSGMYYYGYRFYDPKLQRWVSRDPLGEKYDLNIYRFAYSSPPEYIDPAGQWGVGVTAGGAANVGVVGAGAGITGAVGAGVFWGGPSGLNPGVFASGGMFARESPGVVSLKKPDYDQSPWALGAYAGGGWGGFLTNAKKPCDLKGPFKQWNLNTPIGSINFGWSSGTWILSVTAGPGDVADVSGYPTTTAVYPTQ